MTRPALAHRHTVRIAYTLKRTVESSGHNSRHGVTACRSCGNRTQTTRTTSTIYFQHMWSWWLLSRKEDFGGRFFFLINQSPACTFFLFFFVFFFVLLICLFVVFFKWRSARANSSSPPGSLEATVAKRAEITVVERSLTSCV